MKGTKFVTVIKYTARAIIDQLKKDNRKWLLTELAFYKKKHFDRPGILSQAQNKSGLRPPKKTLVMFNDFFLPYKIV